MEREGLDGFDAVVVTLLAGATATGTAVWGGAVLAAGAGSRLWLDAGASDAVTALTRLPEHMSDPARAWPGPISSRLPGPILYWSATAVAVAMMGAVALAAARWWHRRDWGIERRRRLGVDTQARFAHRRELAPLLVRGPVKGRFILGRSGRWLVATESRTGGGRRPRGRSSRRRGDRGAVAMLGPSRCGKTTAAIAGILDWEGPAVLSSVKADLMAATIGWRRGQGEVRVFDPTGSTSELTACWSPLRDATSTLGAQRAARALVDAAPREGVEGGSDFWLKQAEILLSGLLWVAATSPGHSMRDVASWVFTQDHPRAGDGGPGVVFELLQVALADKASAGGAGAATEALLGVWQLDDRTRASVYATAQTVVWPWMDPGVAESARRSDIDLGWLRAGDNTVYLCAPIEDQQRLAPAFGGLLSDLIKQVAQEVGRTGRPLDPPLLVVIDEAGNTPLRSLPEYASTVAGLGVQLVTIWQSRAQIDFAYGRQADSVLTNHLSKLFYAGASDLSGLEMVSRLLGQEQVGTHQLSADVAGVGHRQSITTSGVESALAPVHIIRQMHPGDAVLVHGTLPPAHLRTRPYYRDRRLRARAEATNVPSAPDGAPRPRYRGVEV